MTKPSLTLTSVSCVLPDGRTLFSDLTESFDQSRTGLVGRNGVGKTVLARILTGELEPTSGHCTRTGTVYYLSQQVARLDQDSVAALAGVQTALDALERIESGSVEPEDFEALGDRWDLRQRLQTELEGNGLGHLNPETSTHTLSGGEAMRVALIGAVLSDADFLILDEPSNHLDRPGREALIGQLRHWPKGLLVISHDRLLLETMERIVELSPLGLRSYGGGYGFYAQCKAQERENATQRLEHLKLERRREEQSLREQRERLERRQSRGSRKGREANQAKILLDRQKERSEGSAGRLRQQQDATRERLNQQVREAARQVVDEARITLHALPVTQTARRRVVELDDVELPFAPLATRRISLTLYGRQRVGVVGPNGCGKSTLLQVLAGRLMPVAGHCAVPVDSAWLDQRLADLVPQRSVIEQMLAANPAAGEEVLRMKLAQLDLDAHKVSVPSGQLSGGERLKAAVACVLYADPPAELLLLDEPGNHLDLPSLQALETLLRGYQGALVVVSHDGAFLDNLDLTDRLLATPEGWILKPW